KIVNLSSSLKTLRDATKKGGWGKQLKGIVAVSRYGRILDTRTASRLLEIGSSWWVDTGPLGSDILKRLPNDLHKLTWLAKLDPEQLDELLRRFDCRAASRPNVI